MIINSYLLTQSLQYFLYLNLRGCVTVLSAAGWAGSRLAKHKSGPLGSRGAKTKVGRPRASRGSLNESRNGQKNVSFLPMVTKLTCLSGRPRASRESLNESRGRSRPRKHSDLAHRPDSNLDRHDGLRTHVCLALRKEQACLWASGTPPRCN